MKLNEINYLNLSNFNLIKILKKNDCIKVYINESQENFENFENK
jgi:hypothetical protein